MPGAKSPAAPCPPGFVVVSSAMGGKTNGLTSPVTPSPNRATLGYREDSWRWTQSHANPALAKHFPC